MSVESAIQTYFDAFNRHDLEGMLATLAEGVAHDVNEGGREVGLDAFRAFKTHMDKCYREQIRDLVIMTKDSRGTAEFIVDGEYIATDDGLPEATGQKYSIPAAAIFEVNGEGKIIRVTSYYNLKGWIAAIS
jgi:steroid delta-isomerase-like uncharacterized protein